MACARLLGKLLLSRNAFGGVQQANDGLLVATRGLHNHIKQAPSILKHRQNTQTACNILAATTKQQISATRRNMATANGEPFNGIKPLVTFVLGGPGSGKGTQCKFICDEFGYKHLSAGDLLRAERNSPGSQYGELIESHIQAGTIVPVEITCGLLERAMLEHCQTLASQVKRDTEAKNNGDKSEDVTNRLKGKFLIDGFPRNEDNLTGWARQVGDKVGVTFVLFLDCPHDVCIKRCLERGQQGSNRSDDNEVSLKKRLVTYTNDTMPIVKHYEKLDLLKKVDATKSPEKVYAEVRKLFM